MKKEKWARKWKKMKKKWKKERKKNKLQKLFVTVKHIPFEGEVKRGNFKHSWHWQLNKTKNAWTMKQSSGQLQAKWAIVHYSINFWTMQDSDSFWHKHLNTIFTTTASKGKMHHWVKEQTEQVCAVSGHCRLTNDRNGSVLTQPPVGTCSR